MSVPATTGCPAGLTYVPEPLKGMINPLALEAVTVAASATTGLGARAAGRFAALPRRIAGKGLHSPVFQP